jgi:poly(3-hydroxybutyrate) depolymerase
LANGQKLHSTGTDMRLAQPKLPNVLVNAGPRLPDKVSGRMQSEYGALSEVYSFGANPGALRMLTYMPDRLSRPAPLVVVLHGCTQSASSYADGAGWIELADRLGFGLLVPE